ncbi:MAG: DnaJ domain-containing protein [Bacteroidia bacterium]
MVNLYEILGLQAGATEKEIKRAFRVMAKKYHPDVSTELDAQAKFNEVYSAYEILGDSQKRRYYDDLLSEPAETNTDNNYYYDDSPVYEWREEAYATANNFGNMTFKDFRDQQIMLHQWSSVWFFENLINIITVLILVFAVYVTLSAFPFKGNEQELALKERHIGFGLLLSLISTFLIINTIRIQINNYKIRKDLKS